MTLVRKNIICEINWHKIYNISLWANIFVYVTFDHVYKIMYILSVFKLFKYLRFTCNYNKYLLWNILLPLYLFIKDSKATSNTMPLMLAYIVIVYFLIAEFRHTKKLWVKC